MHKMNIKIHTNCYKFEISASIFRGCLTQGMLTDTSPFPYKPFCIYVAVPFKQNVQLPPALQHTGVGKLLDSPGSC